MLLRRLGVLAAALTALSAPVTAASASPVGPAAPVLTITGAVSDPASYTMSQLTALPTETFTLPRGTARAVSR
jgi:DMSO/TMAO reductase YedYZ molybdopterin-dependent catalytic subunit